ncbi:MAG: D-alanine--D-alanine ligase [Pseudomonadota bacterium]
MSVQAREFGRVAVLLGGTAAEREISLLSGQAVLQGLRRRGVDAHAADVTGPDIVAELARGAFDRAFVVLHGRGGEDGVIQGALETLGLPYTGSGVLGSAVGMDKYRTKLIWRALGIPTPEFILIQDDESLQAARELGFPLMIKPSREGSSIGMKRVDDTEALRDAWSIASEYDTDVLAERWVTGAEYTAAILGNEALPLIRLETPRDFYDYHAKYQANDTRYLIPCGLDTDRERELQALAGRAFRAIGAHGWGRVDLLTDETGQALFIEVNTVPGMTDHSLVPMAARAAGIDFDELVWRILVQTLETQG